MTLQLTAQRDSLKLVQDLLEQLGVRVAFGKGYHDPAHTDLNVSADLEQLQTNGVALRLGHGRAFQSQTPQVLHQHIGKRGEI